MTLRVCEYSADAYWMLLKPLNVFFISTDVYRHTTGFIVVVHQHITQIRWISLISRIFFVSVLHLKFVGLNWKTAMLCLVKGFWCLCHNQESILKNSLAFYSKRRVSWRTDVIQLVTNYAVNVRRQIGSLRSLLSLC